jgi:streptogramin lyase
VGVGFYSQQRALRQAAGRWVIPPEELKLSRRIGSGSFGEVFIADWNGTEVAQTPNPKSYTLIPKP